jgi:hypothetical protein
VQAVKRNIARFPEDFVFQLSREEFEGWRSQIVISNLGAKKGLRHAPYIVRTFVRVRQILATNEELARMVAQHDRQIAVLFENVQKMLAPAPGKKNPIGFVPPKD